MKKDDNKNKKSIDELENKTTKENIKSKKKGFTLIELLAVIIILGVLMIIAIPSVTTYINESRKQSYIDTVRNIIGAARNFVNDGKRELYDENVTYYIPVSCLKSENGTKTPFGEFTQAYVLVKYNGKGFNYYFTGTDSSHTGIKKVVSFDNIKTEDLSSGVQDTDIKLDIGVEDSEHVISYNSDCSAPNEKINAGHIINQDGEVNDKPEPLSPALGDYIYYKPAKTSYTIDRNCSGVTSNQTINPSNLDLWRVIKVNDDGTIEIISEYVSSEAIKFYGKKGFTNFTGCLNAIAAQFETSGITVRSRNYGYNGQTEYITDTSKITTSVPWGCDTGETCSNPPQEPLGGGDNYYLADENLIISVLGTKDAYRKGNTSTKYGYWRSSRYYFDVSWGNTELGWGVQATDLFCTDILMQNDTNIYGYVSSDGGWQPKYAGCGVRPIVTLKKGIGATEGDGTKNNPYKIN